MKHFKRDALLVGNLCQPMTSHKLHSFHRVQQQELMEKKKTHSGPFPVSNKAAEQRWSQPFGPKRLVCPDPLSHFSSPALLLRFSPHRFPLSLFWGRWGAFLAVEPTQQETTWNRGKRFMANNTRCFFFYPLGGVLAQQDTRDDVLDEDELWSDSLGLEFSFPCALLLFESQVVAARRWWGGRRQIIAAVRTYFSLLLSFLLLPSSVFPVLWISLLHLVLCMLRNLCTFPLLFHTFYPLLSVSLCLCDSLKERTSSPSQGGVDVKDNNITSHYSRKLSPSCFDLVL